jgi:superfamily II DNA/RNA helicase
MDEADELLSNTFEAQIRYIVEHIGESTQIGLYSATMPPDKLEIAERFMQDPIHILVKAEELTLEGISQFYIYMDRDDWKYETLQDLYAAVQIYQLMIYCNSKKRVDMLARRLSDAGLTCSCIHGELSSQERVDTMRKFRTGENRILITTDLLARGIDVQQVSLVINYDIPFDMENYIHRIGRSGRFGRKGVSLNFVAGQRDAAQIKKIENYYHTQINEFPSDVESAFRNIS